MRRLRSERRHSAASATAVKHTSRTGLAVAATMALFAALPSRADENLRPTHDDAGDPVTVKPGQCRFVSLAPGTTAMLYAAGAAHCLVGTIAHSTEPADAVRLPIVGDAETLDFEQLLALRPTVVVVAVDVVQRMRIDRIKAMGIPVYQVHVTRLGGMADSIRRLGALAGTQAIADREADALNAALEALGTRYRTRTPIRVLYQIWDRPIYTIGGRHVITDALQLCGAVNIFSDLGSFNGGSELGHVHFVAANHLDRIKSRRRRYFHRLAFRAFTDNRRGSRNVLIQAVAFHRRQILLLGVKGIAQR